MIALPELFAIMRALGDEKRYNIVKLLLQHNYCVGALAQRLELSESAVSQHLKILRTAGLVKGEKRGYFTHYYVDRAFLKEAAKGLLKLSELKKSAHPCCHRINKNGRSELEHH